MNFEQLTQHPAFAEFQNGVISAMMKRYGTQQKLLVAMMSDPVAVAKQGVLDYQETCKKLGEAVLQKNEEFAKILYPFL